MRPSPLCQASGAVTNPGCDAADPDRFVPAHWGQPLREQRALAAGKALVALPYDVVSVTGPDRLSWLTTLSSQVLTGLQAGDGGAETLILDAQGHISYALAAYDDGEQLYLFAEVGYGEGLVHFLDSMRFMLRVQVAPREDLAVIGAHGSGVETVEEAARRVDAYRGTWRDPWPGVVEGGTSYDVGVGSETAPFVHPGRHYQAGLVLVAADRVREIVAAARECGMQCAGMVAWEALRVEAGRPRHGRDVDERTIPHELDWLRTAVHLSKGCFPGQETIARVLNLGRPPRRLTILQLDGLTGELPSAGDAVWLGERRVGTVTTVVRHHDYGPMALALLRRAVPADAPLTVDVSVEAEAELESGTDAEGASGELRASGNWNLSASLGLGDCVAQGRTEPVGARSIVGRVDAVQELLVCPDGKAQASPAERPGAQLRTSMLGRPA